MNRSLSLSAYALASLLLTACASSESPYTQGGGSSTNIISDINFSVAASELNPVVYDPTTGITYDNISVDISVKAGDKNNVAVTSGTIYFESEYGLLTPNFCTLDATGTCSITWTSITSGLPADLMTEIVGYTLGEESYFDADGNGIFNDGDTPLTDTDEPYVDYNHNGTFDAGVDRPIDLDNSGAATGIPHTPADGLMSVSSCAHSTLCAPSSRIYIYNSVTLSLSGAGAAPAVGNAPTATITAPTTGSTVSGTVNFTANISDTEDGAAIITSGVVWSSDIEGTFASNTSSTSIDTTAWQAGTHNITLSVTDSDGNTVTDIITITVGSPVVGNAPTATITAPTTGSTITGTVNFTATISDVEDATIITTGVVDWSSDVQGSFATNTDNTNIDTSTWAPGAHVITLSVTDSDGNTTTDTINVNVVIGTAPTASITAPATGTTVSGTVNFTATANDAEDGAITVTGIDWSSDIEGSFATNTLTPGPDTSAWTPGAHVITLSVTDSDGNTVTDTINLTVDAFPTATITAPAGGATITAGTLTTFTVDAQDNEDGAILGTDTPVAGDSISWDSDQVSPGAGFGTTNTFDADTTGWTVGIHTITVTVTDSFGNTTTDTISITIN